MPGETKLFSVIDTVDGLEESAGRRFSSFIKIVGLQVDLMVLLEGGKFSTSTDTVGEGENLSNTLEETVSSQLIGTEVEFEEGKAFFGTDLSKSVNPVFDKDR